MSAPRVFFYVQYLQGVGHLHRTAHIAAAMAQTGFAVDLVSGGVPVPGLAPDGVRVHQLPPIRCRDGDFGDLVDVDGAPVDDAFKDRRRDALLDLFRGIRPAALVIEAFPFGRRQMRFELMPLLEAARETSPRPLVVCSVRDVLQTGRKPGRAQETLDLLDAFFDHVLVHGDPAFARLDMTFPRASEIAEKVQYTGLVGDFAKNAPVSKGSESGEVLVSAGGGATRSEVLLSAAMQARALTNAKDRTWRLLAGPNLPPGAFEELSARKPDGVVLEPNRRDFPDLLASSALSVSQAGYNTVVDVLRCGCPAVLVPYAARGETEQLTRARRMEELGLARVVEPDALSPETLARAIDAALAGRRPKPVPLDVSGAEKSAESVSAWLRSGREGSSGGR